MNRSRFWLRVAVAATGAATGMLIAVACSSDDCDCPEPERVALGEFRIQSIVGADDPTAYAAIVERGATLRIARGSVTIDYETEEGETSVEYRAFDSDGGLAP